MSYYSDRLQYFYIIFIFIYLLTAQIENISMYFICKKNVINKISFMFKKFFFRKNGLNVF
jgi:hypothetical protein